MYEYSNSLIEKFFDIPRSNYSFKVTSVDDDQTEVIRYFCKPVNRIDNLDIIEIDKSTYDYIKSNPLYKKISLRWKIKGKLNDIMGLQNVNTQVRLYTGVLTANRLSVELADKEMPGLKDVVKNYLREYKGE